MSFIFMVSCFLFFMNRVRNHEESYAKVLSSVIAAWADVTSTLGDSVPNVGSLGGLEAVSVVVHKLNIGYFWMLVNCLTSAAYVSASASEHR